MDFILPVFLLLLCLLIAYWACINSSQIYQPPFFITIAFLAFVFPQLWQLYLSPYPLTLEMVDRATLMSIFCVFTSWASYTKIKISRKYLSKFVDRYSLTKFFYWGVLYSIIGNFCFSLIASLPEDYVSSQPTGIFVAYLFFARLIYPGFTLLLIPTLSKPTSVKVIICLLASVQPIIRFLIFGRRTEFLIFVCILLVSFFFIKKIIIPKQFLVLGIVIGWLFSSNVGQYRLLVAKSQISIFTIEGVQQIINSASSIDWLGGSTNSYFGSENKTSELRLAASAMNVVQINKSYDFGSVYWNKIVFNYFPAQLFGEKLKKSFYLPSTDITKIEYFGAKTFRTGLTITCVGELFIQFWFFGCLVFYIIAFLLKYAWILATEYNNLLAQVIYCLMLPFCVVAVGAGTANLFSQIVYYGVFLFPVALYSKNNSPLTFQQKYNNTIARY